jgi:hypothetical protein
VATQDFPNVSLPPTQPRPWATPENRPVWPTVIGIIGIVVGGLGLMGGLWGAIAPFFLKFMASYVPETERATLDVAQRWRGWTIPLSLVSGAVAVALLLAGIALLRRRARARQMCLTWAVAKMLLVLFSTVVGYRIAQQTVELTAQQSTSAPGMTPVVARQFAEVGTMVGLGFGLVWGWALPVFLLIWFGRGRIRDEVARWV